MRAEKEIRDELAAARKAYREADETQPRAKTIPLSLKVKTLMRELSGCISEDAGPCPKCGAAPHGMRFQHYVKEGVEISLYEVGCLDCDDMQSRGGSAGQAVENWNAGNYHARPKR